MRASSIVQMRACSSCCAPIGCDIEMRFFCSTRTSRRSNQTTSLPKRGASCMLMSSCRSIRSGRIVSSQYVRSSTSALSNVRPEASSFDQGTPRLIASSTIASLRVSISLESLADTPSCLTSTEPATSPSSPGSTSLCQTRPALAGPWNSLAHWRRKARRVSSSGKAVVVTIVAGTALFFRKLMP
jgi:hypothetical protein